FRSQLSHPLKSQRSTLCWSQLLVRATAAAASVLIGAGGKFGNVRRNVQWRNVDLVLRLRCGNHMPGDGCQEKRDDRRVKKYREHLAGAEIVVLRPSVFYLDGLDPRRQRRLLRRRKEFLDARAESAEIRPPPYGQAAIDGALARGLRAEEFR